MNGDKTQRLLLSIKRDTGKMPCRIDITMPDWQAAMNLKMSFARLATGNEKMAHELAVRDVYEDVCFANVRFGFLPLPPNR